MDGTHPAPSAPRPGIWTLGALFLLLTFPRALLISLLPILALERLGDAQNVSIFYALVSACGVTLSLSIPTLTRRLGASGLLVVGALAMASAGVLLLYEPFSLFVLGMLAYLFGYAAMEIAMTLFVMVLIPRNQLSFFEPRRVLFSATAYVIGPWLGITLAREVAPWWPFVICTAFGLTTALVALALRLHRIPMPPQKNTGNPLRYVRRFFAQPRLRLAWGLTLGRAAWWNMFFVFTPIYAVTYGLGEVTGGALVSVGVAIVWTVPLWGRVGRRFGLRRMLSVSFFACGVVMLFVGAVAETPWFGAALLLLAAVVVTPLDAGGNIPFLRAVRARERAEMTGVFTTYRDTAQLLPPAAFAVVLQVFALPAVFVTSGIAMLALSALARYLPRRL
jgi:MFS transporter, ACDE family, multidrug resistance protein